MKQKIYILGLIATTILLIGVLFKIFHFPGAAILLITGMTTLVLGFLPVALSNNYRADKERRNKSLYIVTWITCFLIFTSMLFKIMHWPGAGILLTISLPFPYIVFLPVFLVVTARDKNFNIYNTVAVLFLLAVMSVISALLALNVSKELIADSIKISGNYNRIEQVLHKADNQTAENSVVTKIDEVLTLVAGYEAIVFSYEGITSEQWTSDPEIIMDRKDRKIIQGRWDAGGRGEVHAELQEALSDIIVMTEKDPAMAALAKALPSVFLMKEQSDHYIWDNTLFKEDAEPWVHTYLDGLRVNLEIIKIII
ncbi:MAG TPA: hypothetical protein P5180_09585 [Bacteroidales bacterium]|nr:hypothetical protein [Bacteroidales bacterium]HPJ59078.1 hypothetical protein [Bacteroidales bacterium]HRW85672.1 hypothetical protein [Bacteroidales bacterium]